MNSRYYFFPLFLLTSLSSFAVDVLVNTSGFDDPFYSFSINDGVTDFNFTNSGSDSLLTGIEYTFTGNNTSHPFRMYITDSQGNTTNLINNLSFRGSQSFTLDTSTDYSTYTKTYVCNVHPSMNGTFNIIPESSSYALLLGGLALGLVALRRREISVI
ncbi:MAG: hypothetical protein CL815_04940 [Coraliomargarita sp.]|nr:hypothetical protein [Coraliomargarita sp.]